MPVALLCLGIVSLLVGLLMAYGGYVNFDFSYGGTLVIAASVAILGGLLVIGLAACLAQLRRIARTLSVGQMAAGALPAAAADDRAAVDEERRLPVLPPRPPAGGRGVAPTGARSPEPAMPADVGSARVADEAGAPAGSEAPEWPRVGPADRFGGYDAAGTGRETRGLPAERGAPGFDDLSSPQQQRGSPILKSGVIEGMAYTLYADGSVEAELPQGIMRFASVTEWRDYLRGDA